MKFISDAVEYLARSFNMGRMEDPLNLDEKTCPQCKKFRLVVEYGFEYCSDGNCTYCRSLKPEEDDQFYNGVI